MLFSGLFFWGGGMKYNFKTVTLCFIPPQKGQVEKPHVNNQEAFCSRIIIPCRFLDYSKDLLLKVYSS